MSVVFAIALCLLLAATLAGGLRRISALLALAGSGLLLAAGVSAAAGWAAASVSLGSWLGFGPAALRVDGLAGIFLALTGASGAAVSLAYLEHPPRRLVTALNGLLLLAMATVLAADQAFVFLLAWETLTLTLYCSPAPTGRRRERCSPATSPVR